jgi:hypothetical protein
MTVNKDKVSKLYRKLVCSESEYEVFQIIERMDAETAKQVLHKLISNKNREITKIAN